MMRNTFLRMRAIASRELGIPEEHIAIESRVADLFHDSLEYLDFLSCVRAEIGEIPDPLVSEAETIGELASALDVPN